MGIPLSPPPSQTPPKSDGANMVVKGTIASATTSAACSVFGPFNIAFWGTFSGTLQIDKTYDGGVTYIPVLNLNTGLPLSITTPATFSLSEPELGVSYIANCTTYTSGTINYRFSTTGGIATSNGLPS